MGLRTANYSFLFQYATLKFVYDISTRRPRIQSVTAADDVVNKF